MESPPPVRRINVFFKHTKKSKYFKAMEIFFKFLHVFCLLDFGFFEFKSYKQRIFWKSITIIQAITIFCVSILLTEDFQNFKYMVYYGILCFFFNVLGLVFINPKKTFYKFFFDLETIDYKLRIDNASHNLEVKVLSIIFLFLFKKGCIIFYYAYCVHFRMPSLLEVAVIWSVTCMHLVLVTYSFAFYSIYCTLKEFVLTLRTASSDFSSLQLIYKRIVELTEGRKNAYDFIFVLALLFNIPLTMCTLFEAVQSFFGKNKSDISNVMSLKCIVAASDLMILFAPAICAGLLATQAEIIRIILHDKLMQLRDASRVREIERFIGYVEVRDCRFRVWKVIPLDADLPGMVLSFCVTYLIVIVQFTNK